MEQEIWKAIPGFEGLYEVSDQGRVKSLDRPRSKGEFLLAASISVGGYLQYHLQKDGKATTRNGHRLVLLAFVGPKPDGLVTRHLDGDPMNNRLSNLVYGTSSENSFDRVRHGRHHNVNKTACNSGHEFTEETTYFAPSRPGVRYCIPCRQAHERKRDRKRVA